MPIFNRPFLHYQIDLLKQVPEIDEVILSLNYQPRRIEEVFGDGSALGIKIRYVVEPEPLGTGGAIKYAAQRADRVGRRLQRRRADADRSGRGHRAASRAARAGDDRADAGGQSHRVWPGRDGRATATSGGFSRSRSADEITTNHINAGIYVLEPDTFDRIPSDVPWSIERSYFPSLIERGETFVAYVYDGYWIDIGTPEKYTQVHRDIMDGRYAAAPFRDHAAGRARWWRRRARSRRAPRIEGPCFIDEGVVVKAGARIGPYPVHRPRHADRRERRRSRARSSGRTAASAATPSVRQRRSSAATASSAATSRVNGGAVLGDKTD